MACAESYKAEAAQAVMDLIRAKSKDNVVRLFGAPQASPAEEAPRANVVHLGAR